ncbi:Spy/CpxP family protein refolding chaperone [Reichenbachiella sp. MALMAid0571]|uniref:Spy/CpxP family protein refolding chaperone n=1 Tax=Reichenbachiella sp. MALMAid0571 TaxID=3143939 RepID=UPI0032E03870
MKRSIVLLSALVLIGTASIAQSPQMNKMGQRQKMMHANSEKPDRGERFAQALELTDAQKTKIEEIHFAAMKSMKSVKNTIGEKEAKLKTLSSADNPDLKAITKVAEEIGDLRTKMFVSQVQTKQEVRALLDEKQKFKFDNMNMMMGKKDHHGRGGDGFGQMKKG